MCFLSNINCVMLFMQDSGKFIFRNCLYLELPIKGKVHLCLTSMLDMRNHVFLKHFANLMMLYQTIVKSFKLTDSPGTLHVNFNTFRLTPYLIPSRNVETIKISSCISLVMF